MIPILTYILLTFGVIACVGLCVGQWLCRWFPAWFSPSESLVYGLGLAPMVVSMLLYYLLLLPGHFLPVQWLVYALVVAGMLVFFGLRGGRWLRSALAPPSMFTQKPLLEKWADRALVAFFVCVALLAAWQVFTDPLWGHDVMIYALLGDTLASQGFISYSDHLINPENGYYYIGLHGYGFPLLRTLEVFAANLTATPLDYFFRSVTGYYGLLLLAVIVLRLRRLSSSLALSVAVLLFGSFSFTLAVFVYHIDSMRLFALLVSLDLFHRVMRQSKPIISQLAVFGLVLGMSAIIHSINAIFAGLIIGIYLLFMLRNGLRPLLVIAGCALLGGGLHYVLEVLIGNGWIFKAYLP